MWISFHKASRYDNLSLVLRSSSHRFKLCKAFFFNLAEYIDMVD